MIEAQSRALFSSGHWRLSLSELDGRRAIEAQVKATCASALELKSTIEALHANLSFQKQVDKFLAVERKLSGIASDLGEGKRQTVCCRLALSRFASEAATIDEFARKHVLIVLESMERIEVKSGCVEMFRLVAARVGNAIILYHARYNEDLGEYVDESLTARSADRFARFSIPLFFVHLSVSQRRRNSHWSFSRDRHVQFS